MNQQNIKQILIAFGQYKIFRKFYRFFKRKNEVEASVLATQLGTLNLSGKLVFDIGANIGLVTEALLKAGSQVVAIEPNVSLLPEIYARCEYPENLTVLPIAISSTATISKFYISEYSGQSSFYEHWTDSKKKAKKVFVPTLSFDELKNAFGNPYYVKIDVEGSEFDVFLGIKERIPLISFEFHMDQPRIDEALKIMKLYGNLGGFSANIFLEGEINMYFSQWIEYSKFEVKFLEMCQNEKHRRRSYGQILMMS